MSCPLNIHVFLFGQKLVRQQDIVEIYKAAFGWTYCGNTLRDFAYQDPEKALLIRTTGCLSLCEAQGPCTKLNLLSPFVGQCACSKSTNDAI